MIEADARRTFSKVDISYSADVQKGRGAHREKSLMEHIEMGLHADSGNAVKMKRWVKATDLRFMRFNSQLILPSKCQGNIERCLFKNDIWMTHCRVLN